MRGAFLLPCVAFYRKRRSIIFIMTGGRVFPRWRYSSVAGEHRRQHLCRVKELPRGGHLAQSRRPDLLPSRINLHHPLTDTHASDACIVMCYNDATRLCDSIQTTIDSIFHLFWLSSDDAIDSFLPFVKCESVLTASHNTLRFNLNRLFQPSKKNRHDNFL